MRRTVAILVLAHLALAGTGMAGDLSAGYSFARSSAGDDPSLSRHGWNVAVAVGLHRRFEWAAEAAGHYGSAEGVDRDRLTLLAGPRFSFRRDEKYSPFLHALFGLARETAGVTVLDVTISESENRFGMLFGGGLDVRLRGRWALRLDGGYEHSSRSGSPGQNGFRAGVGAAYRF